MRPLGIALLFLLLAGFCFAQYTERWEKDDLDTDGDTEVDASIEVFVDIDDAGGGTVLIGATVYIWDLEDPPNLICAGGGGAIKNSKEWQVKVSCDPPDSTPCCKEIYIGCGPSTTFDDVCNGHSLPISVTWERVWCCPDIDIPLEAS